MRGAMRLRLPGPPDVVGETAFINWPYPGPTGRSHLRNPPLAAQGSLGVASG